MKITGKDLKRDFIGNKYIYLMLIPVVIYYIVFHYYPMYGTIIAFKNFSPGRGILGSPWVGFKNFKQFFDSFYFYRIVRNTILINLYDLIIGYPAPIIFALCLNELRGRYFKRTVQTISYLPHFISVIVISGLILDFASRDGLFNIIRQLFGGQSISFFSEPRYFRTIYVGSNIWQSIGWKSIIYLAALTGIDPEQYEAAKIDGANKWKQTLHVTLPGILKTIIVLFIIRIGYVLSIGAEKIILLYNPIIYETADVISSFVYRRGIIDQSYSYSAAVGLFNSIINFTFLIFFNRLSRKVTDYSLW